MYSTDLLTVEEIAAYLRITKGTVWRWCRTGKVPAIKIGHQWRIRRDDLEAMIHPDPPASDGAKSSEEAVAVPPTTGSEV